MADHANLAAAQVAAAKVPEVSTVFWIAKILTTGLGETSSDYLVKGYNPLIVIPLAGAALVLSLALQWTTPRFSKWIYWTAVGFVAIFGTMVADAIHVVLGIPYFISTAGFGLALVAVFVVWRTVEGTLSIHSIITPRREAFYWLTVMTTFALGTAAGDLTATNLGLGYGPSGVLFLILFLLPIAARRLGRVSEVATFWTAYVLTRPLGASFADWIGVGHDRGGLGVGTGYISLVLIAVALMVVAIGPFQSAGHLAFYDRKRLAD
jgi:uncharacterized membrane-anchored protein